MQLRGYSYELRAKVEKPTCTGPITIYQRRKTGTLILVPVT